MRTAEQNKWFTRLAPVLRVQETLPHVLLAHGLQALLEPLPAVRASQSWSPLPPNLRLREVRGPVFPGLGGMVEHQSQGLAVGDEGRGRVVAAAEVGEQLAVVGEGGGANPASGDGLVGTMFGKLKRQTHRWEGFRRMRFRRKYETSKIRNIENRIFTFHRMLYIGTERLILDIRSQLKPTF